MLCETFSDALAAKYEFSVVFEVVPILQYLQEVNAAIKLHNV